MTPSSAPARAEVGVDRVADRGVVADAERRAQGVHRVRRRPPTAGPSMPDDGWPT